MKPCQVKSKPNTNTTITTTSPWVLTREDELLLHDVDVLAGPPARRLQHDLFRVVAAHTAHPEPAAVGGGGGEGPHKSGVRGQGTPGTPHKRGRWSGDDRGGLGSHWVT